MIRRKLVVAFHHHHTGGVELEAVRFAQWLHDRDLLGALLCITNDRARAQEHVGALPDRCSFHVLRGAGDVARLAVAAARLRWASGCRDLVVHGWRSNWPTKVLALLRLAGFRVTYIEHLATPDRVTPSRWRQLCMRQIVHKAIAVSRGAANMASNWGLPYDAVELLWNGTDVERFRDDPERARSLRASLRLRDDTLVLAFVGRMDAGKRAGLAVDCFHRFLRSSARPCHLVMAGDGWRRPVVERQIRELGIEAHVSMLGWVEAPELLYPAVDVLLLLSTYESFPLVVVEALSCGCAVLATDVGDVGELVTGLDGAHVVPVRPEEDVEIPVAWIERYVADRAHIRRENRQRIVEVCDREKVYARVLETLARP